MSTISSPTTSLYHIKKERAEAQAPPGAESWSTTNVANFKHGSPTAQYNSLIGRKNAKAFELNGPVEAFETANKATHHHGGVGSPSSLAAERDRKASKDPYHPSKAQPAFSSTTLNDFSSDRVDGPTSLHQSRTAKKADLVAAANAPDFQTTTQRTMPGSFHGMSPRKQAQPFYVNERVSAFETTNKKIHSVDNTPVTPTSLLALKKERAEKESYTPGKSGSFETTNTKHFIKEELGHPSPTSLHQLRKQKEEADISRANTSTSTSRAHFEGSSQPKAVKKEPEPAPFERTNIALMSAEKVNPVKVAPLSHRNDYLTSKGAAESSAPVAGPPKVSSSVKPGLFREQ